MTRVLFLFTQSEMDEAEELKDVLQSRLGSAVNLSSSIDVIAEDSSLEHEMYHSRCIVLVYSQQCEKYLNEGKKECQDECVTFDGLLIKACLNRKDIIDKLLVVHFGQKPGKWSLDRVPTQRVFQLNWKFKKSDATVDLVVDTIKGIIRK